MKICLSDSDLNRFHAGEMEAEEVEDARKHLASCKACQARDAGLLAEHEQLLQHVRALGGTVNLDAGRSADKDSRQTLPSSETASHGLRPGDCVGPYKLLERIGEGGFGVVFLAEQQEPIRRRVALKILKPGMDSQRVIARFKAEEQALAMMDHPSVARVFDAGTTEPAAGNLPYFVMEYVAGIPITEYCDRHRLDTRQRVELFMLVCDAVQHAHHKGIIHRDLKPSNVLVAVHGGQAVPKVIDFGVAKAISQRLTEQTVFTEQGQLIGTPEYMSPEQAEMSGLNIDTRTDIYSLGVLLYELLVSALPFDSKSLRSAGYAEIQRIVREQDPPKPSTRLSSLGGQSITIAHQRRTDLVTLAGQLRGDLDWITMKALEKDRTRRYSSASEMAADIRRHVDNEPVLASPPSVRYRMRKFIRRHRLGVMAVAAVALALMLGIVGTTIMAVVASQRRDAEHQQRRLAEQAKQEAEKQTGIAMAINAFLQDMLAAPDPFSARPSADKAKDVRVLDVLAAASRKIETAFDDKPEIEAAVRTTLGITYVNLDANAQAERHLQRALDLRRSILGNDHPDTLETISDLGGAYLAQGKLQAAEPLCQQALDGRLRVLGADHPDTLKSIIQLGVLRHEQGRDTEAETFTRQAVEISRRVLGDRHPTTLASINNLAALLQVQGQLEEAEGYLREALAGRRETLGSDHPSTLRSLSNLGCLLNSEGEYAEAERCHREALAGYRRTLGDDHADTIRSINDIGIVLDAQSKPAEAETYYRQAIESYRRVLGENHPLLFKSIHNLAMCLQRQGKPADAEDAYRQAAEGRRQTLGPDHPDTLRAITDLGALLRVENKLPEAEVQLRQVLDAQRRALGDEHPDTLDSMDELVVLLFDQGKFEEADSLARQVVDAARRTLPANDRLLLTYQNHLGEILLRMEQYDEAEPHLIDSYTGFARIRADDGTRYALEKLIELYDAWGKPEKAAEYRALLPTSQPDEQTDGRQ